MCSFYTNNIGVIKNMLIDKRMSLFQNPISFGVGSNKY
jgi:hypothetical protein